jgi:hypothetical protein
MTQPHREFKDDHIPLAYLITFRSYGTWLHGKEGSVDRFHNVYGQPKLPAKRKATSIQPALARTATSKAGWSKESGGEGRC